MSWRETYSAKNTTLYRLVARTLYSIFFMELMLVRKHHLEARVIVFYEMASAWNQWSELSGLRRLLGGN